MTTEPKAQLSIEAQVGRLDAEYERALEANLKTTDRVLTWLVVGNAGGLALLYGSTLEELIAVTLGIAITAGCFTVGMVAGVIAHIRRSNVLSYALEILDFRIRQLLGHHVDKESEQDAQRKMGEANFSTNILLVISSACFLLGATSPLTGLLRIISS